MSDTASTSPDATPADEARVLRALAVLEALAAAGQPYTLSQLSARLRKPSFSRASAM